MKSALKKLLDYLSTPVDSSGTHLSMSVLEAAIADVEAELAELKMENGILRTMLIGAGVSEDLLESVLEQTKRMLPK